MKHDVAVVEMLVNKLLEERAAREKEIYFLRLAIRNLLKDWPKVYEPANALKEIKIHLEALSQ